MAGRCLPDGLAIAGGHRLPVKGEGHIGISAVVVVMVTHDRLPCDRLP